MLKFIAAEILGAVASAAAGAIEQRAGALIARTLKFDDLKQYNDFPNTIFENIVADPVGVYQGLNFSGFHTRPNHSWSASPILIRALGVLRPTVVFRPSSLYNVAAYV